MLKVVNHWQQEGQRFASACVVEGGRSGVLAKLVLRVAHTSLCC